MNAALDSGHILHTATAFWASRVLLTAEELGRRLKLHPRGTYDFFDALVALKFLERDGDGPAGRYRNTRETAAFLDRKSPAYIGGLPDMLNSRLFGFWNNLGTALKTGKPQNEMKNGGKGMFEELYADEARLGQFLEAMTGFQAANFMLLAGKFEFIPLAGPTSAAIAYK